MYSISKKSLEKMMINEANRELKHRQAINASRKLYKEAALNRKKHYKSIQEDKARIDKCESELSEQLVKMKKLENNIQIIKENRNKLKNFKNKHSKFIREMKKLQPEKIQIVQPGTTRSRKKPNRYSPS
jgi:DNA repair exonuclease SbcCD ATPase subunit